MMDQEELKQQATLVEACIRKEAAAMEKFYNRFASKMYGVCLRYMDNPDDAKDLLHDGFIKAFQSLGQFKNEGSLEGWLRRLFVNKALEILRSRKVKWAAEDLDAAEQLPHSLQTDSSLTKEEIFKEIQQLAPGYKTVLNLFIIEGYTHEEISKMLGISVSTSKSQLFRARQILMERFTKTEQWETKKK